MTGPAISFSGRSAGSATPFRGAEQISSDTIGFGGGLPDPRLHPTETLADIVAQILRENDHRVLAYGYEAGELSLRSAVAERMREQCAALDAEQIVLTNGSSGAIALAALAVIDPGDNVVVERLTYPAALNIFRQMGANVVAAPMDDAGLRPDALEQVPSDLARRGTPAKLLYTISTCQSPTGTILDLERRAQIVQLAERFNLLILQDDTYGDIRFADDIPPPFIALAPERTIHAGSFSKVVAPGLRVGWTAASPAITSVLKQVRTDLGTSPILQQAVARFITSGGFATHLKKITPYYRKKRNVLDEALRRYCTPYGSWRVPDGGLFIWLSLNDIDVRDLAPHAAAEKVFSLNAPHFSAGDVHTSGIRLAFGQIPLEHIEEGVRRLPQALERASTARRTATHPQAVKHG